MELSFKIVQLNVCHTRFKTIPHYFIIMKWGSSFVVHFILPDIIVFKSTILLFGFENCSCWMCQNGLK